ncbi:hypothetical protein TNCV_4721301 [Trichonephila clavipes]|uniref:Uncharacterized protein n=1 Tax=Trichonephila clavipes TaxID=2585209 RepID=A0A8X6W640_TRICX|nr:hypothetical protein TNCV_4721301 [Trichonephila clavipes]
MVVEFMQLQIRSGMKRFLTGWEVILRLAIVSASNLKNERNFRPPGQACSLPNIQGDYKKTLPTSALQASVLFNRSR